MSANASHENANVSQPHYENEYLKKKLEELTALHENAVALHSMEKKDLSNNQEIIKKSWWQFCR